jgi:hypothetical protein
MNKVRFTLYNPASLFRDKDKDDISTTLGSYLHNGISVKLNGIYNNYFEIEMNADFNRSVTGHISRYLSRKCSLDHLYGQEGKKRRLFSTVEF